MVSIGRGAYAALLDEVIARTGARGAFLLLFRVSEDGLLVVERETHLFTPMTPGLLAAVLHDTATELATPDPEAPAESGVASRPPATPAKTKGPSR